MASCVQALFYTIRKLMVTAQVVLVGLRVFYRQIADGVASLAPTPWIPRRLGRRMEPGGEDPMPPAGWVFRCLPQCRLEKSG